MFLRLASVFVVSTIIMIMMVAAVTVSSVTAEETGGVSWTVYHSWNPSQEFTRRGTISWNKDAVEEESNIKKDTSVLQIINDETATTLSSKDIQEMLNYGWYHVKIVSGDDYILQTVPACNVRRANFKDQFDVTIPRSTTKITSFAYTPLISPLAPKTCEDYAELESDVTKSFVSKVNVELDTPGLPLQAVLQQTKPPPGLKFMKRPASAKSKSTADKGSADYVLEDDVDPEGEETKPQPTGPFAFLQKYWYVILPMVLMQFLSPPPEPEGGQQQGGQAQQGQQPVVAGGAGAASSGAAAPSNSGGGSGKKSRRGKRGN
jgi:hypothetical protein